MTSSCYEYAYIVMQNIKRYHISGLLILAIMTMLASPFCQFKSGKSGFIEICTVYGIQKIAVPANENGSFLFTDEKGDTAPQNNKQSGPDTSCPFCFSASCIPAVIGESQDAQNYTLPKTILANFYEHSALIQHRQQNQQPRAPPQFS